MRPVDEMVDTAEAIAAGDLTRRVPDLDPDTELGRLGLSLNEMLAHLEEAVEVVAKVMEKFQQKNSRLKEVIFCCFDTKNESLYREKFS